MFYNKNGENGNCGFEIFPSLNMNLSNFEKKKSKIFYQRGIKEND